MRARNKRIFIFATRTDAVRFARRINTALGYPRQLTEDDITRVGNGPHPPPRVVSYYTRPRAVSAGRFAGSWAVLLDVLDPEIAALNGRQLGSDVVVDLSAGQVIESDFDGSDEAP